MGLNTYKYRTYNRHLRVHLLRLLCINDHIFIAFLRLYKGLEIKANDEKENKFLSNIGLLSIKPKIIVCNVDEESVSKGNIFTESVKEKHSNEVNIIKFRFKVV